MMKLSNLKSPIGQLAPVIKRLTDAEGHAPDLEPWRGWYKLAEWERTRRAAFARDHYTCQECNTVTARPIGDHKDPTAKQSRARFMCVEEVQTLCKPCHDGKKQTEEAGIRRAGGYA
jgi:5-methylcytosine-specific restriction protein A